MKKYTVIGYYEESGQIFSHHVLALTPAGAFYEVAKDHSEAEFVCALDGHVSEDEGVSFPGGSLVCSETVLEQADIFC